MLIKKKNKENELVQENIKAELSKERNVSTHSVSVPDPSRELKLVKEKFDHEIKLLKHRLFEIEQEKEATRQEANMARQEVDMAIQEAAKLEDALLQERQARNQEKTHAQCTTERLQLALEEEEKESEEIRRNLERMREAHLEEEEQWRKEMADLQRRLLNAETQIRQVSEPTQADITQWKTSRDNVRITEEIGIGAWGTVARGVYRGQQVAVKWPHRMILNQQTLERLERETQLMTQVRHPNLLRIVAAVFDDKSRTLRASPMIITELLDLNLRQCYERGRLQDSSKMPIFRDVAYGLHYLHDRLEPIIHRDVSAPNILLKALPAGLWRAKVSDFGSANLARLSRTAGEGAIIYTAPEAFPQTNPKAPRVAQTTKIDVFSYGILMCEVLTAKLPDPEHYLERLELVKGQSPRMHVLIVSCTNPNPDQRPTMASVIDQLHKFPQPRPRNL